MNCQEVMELIQRNLDHDLHPGEQEKLNEHLLTCKECREWQKKLQAVSNELEHLPDVQPPYSIVDRMFPQIEADAAHHASSQSQQTQAGKSRWHRPWLVAGSVAACLFLIVSIQSLFSDADFQLNRSENAADESMTPMIGDTGMDGNDNAPAVMESNNANMDASYDDGNMSSMERTNEFANNENNDHNQPESMSARLQSPANQYVAVHVANGVYVYDAGVFAEPGERNEEEEHGGALMIYEQEDTFVLQDWYWESNDILIVRFVDSNDQSKKVEMDVQAQQVNAYSEGH